MKRSALFLLNAATGKPCLLRMASSAYETRSKIKREIEGLFYLEAFDLPNGFLPRKKDISECMMYLLRPARAFKVSELGLWRQTRRDMDM